MGIYLNPGNENFKEVLRNGKYVDKTMMIAKINHIMDQGNKYVCLSRPRRFGKTIAGETFILIIDEYDVLVKERADKELFDAYLSFLNGLFKSDTLRPAISLAYLTGILPVVRDKIQSKLNNFEEYTILDAYNLSDPCYKQQKL